MADKLQFGIVSTGSIASCFAAALQSSQHATLRAVASRAAEQAKTFGEKFGASASYGDLDAMLADKSVEAVYVATPHPYHIDVAIKALDAGKHVLVEKPMTLNHAEAMLVADAARRNGKFVAEAFMYRCHPQTAKLCELIKSGVIGRVQVIETTFSFRAGENFNPQHWVLNPDLGGGGILNMGGYPLSLAMLVAGVANDKPFAEPQSFKAIGVKGPTGVDVWAQATLQFEGQIIAQIGCGHQLNHANDLRAFGTDGWIHVPNPWTGDRQKGGTYKIHVHKGGKTETHDVTSDRTAYAHEADAFALAVRTGATQFPAVSLDESLAIQRGLDTWRQQVGMAYPSETPKSLFTPRTSTPAFPDELAISTLKLDGLDKPVSRLVMGCDNQQLLSHAAVMFDAYVAQGGNTFDTSYIYGGGIMEKLLGQWMKARNCRDRMTIVAKGAVTPFCLPDVIGAQLGETLDRLQTDHTDIYIMHRDNVDVPVGEFVDVIDELHRKGKLKLWGGSNWTLPRVQAAIEYAKKNNRLVFTCLSNNFSLARMENPVWAGCVACSTDEFRGWLSGQKTVTNFSWSSQARGFFTDRAGPDKRSDAELVNSWYSDNNFERRRRALELADKLKVAPINIALAYVLNQPFNQCALVGPRTLEELRTTLPGLRIELTPEQLAWLDLRA